MDLAKSATVILAVTLTFGSDKLAAQVLNMSHDLVPLGIASQNLTPNNPSLDARPLFQAALQYVQNHPVQTLTLDQGAYYLLTATQGNAVLIVPGLSNLMIDLAGSTLYFNGPLLPNGIQLYYCTNLTLRNFQLDYINPPYTHVQLVSVDIENRVLTYQTLPGYPDPSTFNSLSASIEGYWAAIFRNGSIVPGTSRTLLSGPFTNNKITIQDGFPWAQSATLATLQAGDTVVVTARGGGPPLLIWECNGVTLSNISIYGSPTWAIQLFQTSNSTVDHVRVVPRPGYGLIGSNADGIHFAMTGPNNHIRNCYVARTMDDGLVMDNQQAGIVVSQAGPRQLTVTRSAYIRFPNGSLMNFVDRTTTLESTGGIIVSQNPPDSPGPSYYGQVNLTFDRDPPTLAPGTIMAFGSPANRGQGSTIEDNLVEDTYGGRGVWLAGVESVTVQRNVLRRTSNAGISAASSTESVIDPHDAGPPAHDITITDNALEQSLGPEAAGSGLGDALAGIQVVTVADPYFVFSSTPSNTNITIQNNYIADSERSGIWIGELNGGTLQNNLVIRYSQNPTLGGVAGIPTAFQSQVMQDALVPVVIHYSLAVAEIGDTVSATSNITAPVSMTPPNAEWPAAGGAGSFSLQTAVTGFAWNAASDSPWLTVTSPLPGAGSGTVQYTVAANNTGAPRTGNITIAGVTFIVQQTTLTTPVLSIAKTHTGNFTFGQTGATYTITVSNQAGAVSTTGVVTVADTLPPGLTLVSMVGNGWTCSSSTCTRGDALAGGASYPQITVTVNVAANASSPQVNATSVSGGGSAAANTTDPTVIGSSATLSVSKTKLNFGVTGSTISDPQTIAVLFTGGAAGSWTASSNQPNITVSPASGMGSGTFQVTATPGPSGIVTVTAPGAINSPQQIQVNVTTVPAASPYGSFDTPLDNTTGIAGAIPVTGWALDNVEVASVGIYREPIGSEPASSNGLVNVGNATFVSGARPDVETRFPNAPLNYRAGWGYMLLTNFLPHSGGSPGLGNGTYRLHAIAVNKSGNQTDLGTRTITVDNAHASKPFGTIDTPDQGATVSGNAYVSFGWALTQNPYCIPNDGSTMTVWIDGLPVGHPTYGQRRSDIVNLFPGLCNTNGAVGFFYIDTTKLANGVHTISWVAYDNANRGDGIGSRYFTVQNSATPAVAEPEDIPPSAVTSSEGVKLRRTHDLSSEAESLTTDDSGTYNIEIEELGRIELEAGAATGYRVVNAEKRELPIGSTLKNGVFYWQLGPRFLGDYDLVLIRPGGEQLQVHVKVRVKEYASDLK